MKTNGQILREHADAKGLPLATLAQVRADLEAARKRGSDATMRRLFINHGRLTAEAMEFAKAWK